MCFFREKSKFNCSLVNVFKIHYFLYWGSISAVLNFSLLFITHHGHVTQEQTGVLYCILPLALVFAKPLFCSIADKYTIHEWVLVVAIIGTIISYGLLAALPFLPFTYKHLIWPLFCVFMLFGSIFSGVLTSITDSLVMKVAELEDSNFGRIRVWGTIGWGLMSLVIGELNKLHTSILPSYVPGFLFFVFLELIDAILMLCNLKKMRMEHQKCDLNRERRPTLEEAIEQSISTRASHMHSISQSVEYVVNSGKEQQLSVLEDNLKEDNHKKKRKQISKFVFLTCYHHPMLLKHVFICSVIGMLTALHWNFFPLYLERELGTNDSSLLKNDLNFSNQNSRLVGLASVVQCFAGEMPFMYFANLIVDKIGTKASLNLVLLTFSCRYFLYTIFTASTAYYILFVEVLHGITFGLFYYVMNILAREYSKKMFKVEFDYLIKNVYNQSDVTIEEGCTTVEEQIQKTIQLPEDDDSTFATMQSVMSASYEGFGVAMGSLIAGFVIQNLGFKFVWYLSSATAFVLFLFDLILMSILYLRNKFKSNKK